MPELCLRDRQISHSGLGVGLFVNIFQFLNTVVCVHLRRSEAAMAKKLFYSIQVGAIVH